MADLLRKYSSLYSSTANTFSTGTGETITPASVTGLPTTTEITLTFDRVNSGGTATPSSMERIIGTIAGGNLGVRTSPSSGRGADSSDEQAHTTPVVEMVWNAKDWNDAIDAILVQHSQAGLHTDITASTVTASAVTSTAGLNATTMTASDIVSTETITASEISSTGGITASQITASSIISQTASTPIRFNDSTYVVPATYTPAGAATATLDVSQASTHEILMPAGNITIAISNETVGQYFTIEITQDDPGSRTVTWMATVHWVDGTAPTLTTTADGVDLFGFRVTAADVYQGFTIGQAIAAV